MLPIAADENFNNDIVRGILRQKPDLNLVRIQVPIADVIEDMLLIIECSLDGEWEGQVRYLPLR